MIYTTGYTGKKPEDLAPMLTRLDAILVDIRYSPTSRVPQWRFSTLRESLGELYIWLQIFGNRNYKSGGDIAIDNLAAGISEIKRLLATGKSVVLMCGCKDYSKCHRKVIADALRPRGKVLEIAGWGPGERLVDMSDFDINKVKQEDFTWV